LIVDESGGHGESLSAFTYTAPDMSLNFRAPRQKQRARNLRPALPNHVAPFLHSPPRNAPSLFGSTGR
jgi:hypothetical protein